MDSQIWKRTAGIIIPAKGVDGFIRGAQIRLDVPIKDENDPPEKDGTKYLWLSSANKNMGVTSGSPIHFIGDPFAKTIYVTEGILKSDVAHFLMDRTFVAIPGANNTSQLDPLFALLSQNGTELVVEAHDMDKCQNEQVAKGASKLQLIARSHKMSCRRLIWNPNYKGIDDWQFALKQKENRKKEEKRMNFKQRFVAGLCQIEDIDNDIEVWHTANEDGVSLRVFLGLSTLEYDLLLITGHAALAEKLLADRQTQRFRIYQLAFDDKTPTVFYAFKGFEELGKKGLKQPPASDYSLIHDGQLIYADEMTADEILDSIFRKYNDALPSDYVGRSLSPSDIVELYDNEKRQYFYCDTTGFVSIRFSPKFVKQPNTNY